MSRGGSGRVIHSPRRAVCSTLHPLVTDLRFESADGEPFPEPEADPA